LHENEVNGDGNIGVCMYDSMCKQ